MMVCVTVAVVAVAATEMVGAAVVTGGVVSAAAVVVIANPVETAVWTLGVAAASLATK